MLQPSRNFDAVYTAACARRLHCLFELRSRKVASIRRSAMYSSKFYLIVALVAVGILGASSYKKKADIAFVVWRHPLDIPLTATAKVKAVSDLVVNAAIQLLQKKDSDLRIMVITARDPVNPLLDLEKGSSKETFEKMARAGLDALEVSTAVSEPDKDMARVIIEQMTNSKGNRAIAPDIFIFVAFRPSASNDDHFAAGKGVYGRLKSLNLVDAFVLLNSFDTLTDRTVVSMWYNSGKEDYKDFHSSQAVDQIVVNAEKVIKSCDPTVNESKCYFDDKRKCIIELTYQKNVHDSQARYCMQGLDHDDCANGRECDRQCKDEQSKNSTTGQCEGPKCGGPGRQLRRPTRKDRFFVNCPGENVSCPNAVVCKDGTPGKSWKEWEVAAIALGSSALCALIVGVVIACVYREKKKKKKRMAASQPRKHYHPPTHGKRGGPPRSPARGHGPQQSTASSYMGTDQPSRKGPGPVRGASSVAPTRR